jgi:endonuclease/exonuclease/phosphatase family metal-dependent hydrolase
VPAEISISTWNVWFDKHAREQRFPALLEILRAHDAEIMAFQEVTPPFVRAIQESEWLQKRHWISAVDHNNLGTVLVSRVRPDRLTWTELPTKMGRRLLTADFPRGLRVGVCHLESLANVGLRSEQMRTAFAALRPAPRSILLGDFNFADGAPEALSIDPDFVDAWPAAHPASPGYTRDTRANPMGRFGREDKQERLDRVLLRGPKLKSIEMLGTEPIGEGLYPSDHFGLLARISL